MRNALIVVDVQLDFCEGGALPVTGGLEVTKKVRGLIEGGEYDYVLATKDLHWSAGDNGGHFATEDAPANFVDRWPPHCVERTPGAEWPEEIAGLLSVHPTRTFYKGQGEPAYSGFQGYNVDDETLQDWLLEHEVTELDIVGLAADYCVKATALDAIRLGYDVRVLWDYTAAVGGVAGTVRALREVEEATGESIW